MGGALNHCRFAKEPPMSKSTNVSVSMSPSCARAWRRLERSFTGDEAMLSVMVRGLADAWDESATAIDEASDALDLESRSVGPSSGRLNERRYGKQHISTNKTLQPVPPTETPLPNQIIFQRKQIGGCGRKVGRFGAPGLGSACFRWRIGAGPLTCVSRRA